MTESRDARSITYAAKRLEVLKDEAHVLHEAPHVRVHLTAQLLLDLV